MAMTKIYHIKCHKKQPSKADDKIMENPKNGLKLKFLIKIFHFFRFLIFHSLFVEKITERILWKSRSY